MVRFKHRYLLCELAYPTLDSLSHLPSLALSPSTSSPQPIPSNPSNPPPLALAPPNITESSLIHLLRESLSINFGDLGAGEVGGTFSIKYLSPQTSTLIIRVSREHYRVLWASLTLLRRIGGHPVIVRVTHVSGTIRKVQHAAIEQDRKNILLSHRRALERERGRGRGKKREVKKGVSGGTEKVGGEGEEESVEKKLEESQERIMGLEA